MKFIRKNGRIIPIGEKKKKLETREKKQATAVKKRESRISGIDKFKNASSITGILAGILVGKTIPEKLIAGAVGGLAASISSSALTYGSEKKNKRKLKTNKYRLNETRKKLGKSK